VGTATAAAAARTFGGRACIVDRLGARATGAAHSAHCRRTSRAAGATCVTGTIATGTAGRSRTTARAAAATLGRGCSTQSDATRDSW
jgi:hypothetical protein